MSELLENLMKLFLSLLLVMLSFSSFAREVCVRNEKGIFCGTEVVVQEKDKYEQKKKIEPKKECITYQGQEFCGIECKKNASGADCKQSKSETCLANDKGVVCGFNCIDKQSVAACASKKQFKCESYFDDAKCGVNCSVKFGELTCDEDDENFKQIKAS